MHGKDGGKRLRGMEAERGGAMAVGFCGWVGRGGRDILKWNRVLRWIGLAYMKPNRHPACVFHSRLCSICLLSFFWISNCRDYLCREPNLLTLDSN
jgi:hypothetical protein